MRQAERPRFDLQTTLAAMQLAKIATSLSPKAKESMQGELGGTLALAGAGKSWDQIRPDLTGHGNVVLVDGVLRDVDLGRDGAARDYRCTGLRRSAVPGLA